LLLAAEHQVNNRSGHTYHKNTRQRNYVSAKLLYRRANERAAQNQNQRSPTANRNVEQ
jgi:hypothetical protein